MSSMVRNFVFVLLAAIALPAVAQQIDPTRDIDWPLTTGSGAPSASCAAGNYGQPYIDTTNHISYHCTAAGWLGDPGTSIYASGAPSGSCTEGNFYFDNSSSPYASYVCHAGAWHQYGGSGGGGGSLPTATAPGQILTSTAAGTTYAVQGQVFFQQAGDTISSIESECSSPCTYFLTGAQTITLSASHTLSSNVHLIFQGNSVWTVNGSGFTLTIPGDVQGSIAQHFSTSGTGSIKFGSSQQFVPVEWFGAVGDCSALSCSTDNHVAIQAALNSLGAGGLALLQAKGYGVGTTTLTVTSNSTGIVGTAYGNTIGGLTPSYIVNSSATATILDVGDTVAPTFNVFKNFTLERNATPSGTATGFSAINAQAMTMEKVESFESIRPFYFTGTPAYGSGFMSDLVAGWGKVGSFCPSSGTAVYGFYVDGSTSALNSMRMGRILAADDCSGLHSTGLYLKSATDFEINLFEAASTYYGIQTSGNMGDVDISEVRFDLIPCSGIYINSSHSLKMSIGRGYIFPNSSSCPGIDVESSSGVTISGGMQIAGNWTTASAYLNLSSGNSISGLNFQNCTTSGICILLNSSSANAITGNILASSSWGIVLQSSSYNAITGNVCPTGGGAGAYCISADASSNHNHYLNDNQAASGVPLLTDAGSDNQNLAGVTGSSGTINYTSSQTASTGDNNHLIVFNCTAACSYTLPATQPASTWQVSVISIGSTTVSIVLGGSDTYNGVAAAPVLLPFAVLPIWANSITSTDYRGGTPLSAGTNVSITSSSNGQTVSASSLGGGGSSSYVQLAQNVLSSSASSITFSGISQSYSMLQLKCRAQHTGTGLANLQMQLNGDTGSDYSDGAVFGGANGGPTAGSNVGATSGNIGNLTGSDSSTSIFDISNVEIDYYSSSTGFKDWAASDSLSDTGGTTTNKLDSKAIGGRWFATPAAITSVTVFSSSGSLTAGSACTLYGVQ